MPPMHAMPPRRRAAAVCRHAAHFADAAITIFMLHFAATRRHYASFYAAGFDTPPPAAHIRRHAQPDFTFSGRHHGFLPIAALRCFRARCATDYFFLPLPIRFDRLHYLRLRRSDDWRRHAFDIFAATPAATPFVSDAAHARCAYARRAAAERTAPLRCAPIAAATPPPPSMRFTPFSRFRRRRHARFSSPSRRRLR